MFKSQQLEPIAVIGIGCRFPGAKNPETFWTAIENQENFNVATPEAKKYLAEYVATSDSEAGKFVSPRIGALDEDEINMFDASFFKISPIESKAIDPQHRLLLKVTYEAFENAGYSLKRIAGTKTGVFIGIAGSEYKDLHFEKLENISGYTNIGTQASVASGRISYFFDLKGPSISIDTACSSSLVAINYACNSLHLNDSDLAIAGGVNLVLNPYVTIGFSKANMLSPTGFCRSFDSRADGYVRGEGCGVLLLKRLSQAEKDNDKIIAVIRSTSVNNDGDSPSITVPNKSAQVSLMESALEKCGLDPSQISYVEAHGTGTPVGDPIEATAISEVYNRGRKNKIYIGSVKSNIGHLEPASGIAGLIKAILAIQNKKIPANFDFKDPNKKINFDHLNLEVPQVTRDWDSEERTAAVNSFAFAGTNAHVIVSNYLPTNKARVYSHYSPPGFLKISAKSKASLLKRIDAILNYNFENLPNFLYSINTHATDFDHRVFVEAENKNQLFEALRAAKEKLEKSSISSSDASKTIQKIVLSKEAMVDLLHVWPIFATEYSERINNLVPKGSSLSNSGVYLPVLRSALLSVMKKIGIDESVVNFVYDKPGIENDQSIKALLSDDNHWLQNKITDLKGSSKQLIQIVEQSFLAKTDLNWSRFYAGYNVTPVGFPNYCFDEKSLILDALSHNGKYTTHFKNHGIKNVAAATVSYSVTQKKSVSSESGLGFQFCENSWKEFDFKDKGLIKGKIGIFIGSDPSYSQAADHFQKSNLNCSLFISSNINKDIGGEKYLVKWDSPEFIEKVCNQTQVSTLVYFVDRVGNNLSNQIAHQTILEESDRVTSILRRIFQARPEMKVVLVTVGSVYEGKSEVPNLSSYTVVGLNKTLSLELRGKVSSINIERFDENFNFDLLVMDFGEREVQISSNKCFARRLQRVPSAELEHGSPLQFDGQYANVIVGRGGLARQIATSLKELGQKCIIMTGRTEKSDGEYRVEKLDLESEGQIIEFFKKISNEFSLKLKVFHCAGVVDNSSFFNQSRSSYESAYLPKVFGTLNLLSGLKDLNVDCVYLMSSQTSFIGNAGQCSYSASNGFLDGIALHWKKSGKFPVFTVSTGAWKTDGMGESEKIKKYLDSIGTSALDPHEGREGLKRLFCAKRSGLCVLNADWKKWLAKFNFPAIEKYLEVVISDALNLPQSSSSASKESATISSTSPAPAVPVIPATSPSSSSREDIAKRIKGLVAKIMGFDNIDAIGDSSPLAELGMDSLMFVELRNRMKGEFGHTVEANDVFSYPHVASFVEYYLASSTPVSKETVSTPASMPAAAAPVIPATAPSSSKREDIAKRIKGLVAKIMGFDSIDAIGDASPLADLGMDSLMFVELRNRMKSEFGHTVEANDVFSYPHVASFVDYYLSSSAPVSKETVSTPASVPVASAPAISSAAPSSSKREDIAKRIKGLVAKIMGFDSVDAIGDTSPLAELGMDSLMFVELRNRMKSEFGHTVEANDVFSYPHVASFVDYYLSSSTQVSKEAILTPASVPVAEVPVSLAATPSSSNREDFAKRIKGLVAKIMGFDSVDAIGDTTPLAELGMDSLMFVELRNRMKSEFGHTVEANDVFSYPHVASFVDYYSASSTPVSKGIVAGSSPEPVAAVHVIPTTSPSSSKREDIAKRIKGLVAKIMGFDSVDAIGDTTPLAELGMDSLMFVELRNRMKSEFGHTVEANDVFSYPHVASFVDYYISSSSPGSNKDAVTSRAG